MDVFIAFIVAVAAGVASHLINKWLDGDKWLVTRACLKTIKVTKRGYRQEK